MLLKELKRAILNKKFLIVVFLSICLMLLRSYIYLWNNVIGVNRAIDLTNEGKQMILKIYSNKYHIWIESFEMVSIVFPIFVVMPYLFSIVKERVTHFDYLARIRNGRKKYIINKFLAVCISGGLALAIPETIYYLLLTVFARNEILNPFQLHPYGIFSNMFNTKPDIYILITIVMHFIVGFAFAAFSCGLSSFCTKEVSTYLVPYGVFLTLDIIMSSSSYFKNFTILSAYKFMFREDNYTLINFIVTIILLLIFGIFLFLFNDRRRLSNG